MCKGLGNYPVTCRGRSAETSRHSLLGPLTGELTKLEPLLCLVNINIVMLEICYVHMCIVSERFQYLF